VGGTPESSRIVFSGGCVLTLGERTPNFRQADVLVDDGKVAEIGPGLRARDAERVDAADTVVMPGFVDTHRHASRSLLRNLGSTAGPPRLTPTSWRVDSLTGALLGGGDRDRESDRGHHDE